MVVQGTAMFEVSVGRWPVATTRKKYLWNCEYFSHLYDLLTDLMGSALISLLAYLNAVPLEPVNAGCCALLTDLVTRF